jgi:hypothetical protein
MTGDPGASKLAQPDGRTAPHSARAGWFIVFLRVDQRVSDPLSRWEK